jgi:GNAT superfamily N-acetyltransferase
MPPGRYSLSVVVDPAVRKRGIGTLLYGNALRWAQEQGTTSLESEVRDNCPACLRFAQQHGFAVDRHIFESVLDLSAFDAERFAGVVEAAEASGIRFFTLADLGNTLEAQRMLYELNRRTARDNPSNDDTFAPFEEFRRFVFSASWYRADGQIVAAEGDRWVGMAAVGYFQETNSMYNMFTGVDRAYRGRKLALALKLLAIWCAQRYGAAYLRTNNDSQNAPMLAINRKLGYQPQVGKYRLIQELARRA